MPRAELEGDMADVQMGLQVRASRLPFSCIIFIYHYTRMVHIHPILYLLGTAYE